MRFSVIIPVLNERELINGTIEALFELKNGFELEIIVVDGSPAAETIKAISRREVIKLTSEKGRGRQLNRGAEAASGDVLIFLHADTKLPRNALVKITDAVLKKNAAAGAFSLRLDSENIFLKFISFTANVRTFFARSPYGDQAIFVKRNFFDKIGGYPDIPLMEDVELIKRIKKYGGKIRIIGDRVITSARKWTREGMVYTTAKNHLIRMLYSLGVSPFKLEGVYYNKSRKGGGYGK